MDSFFFNITDTSYKVTGERVDISNGIVFLDIKKAHNQQIKNLDRLIMIAVVKDGSLTITDHLSNKTFITKSSHNDIYCSSKQNFTLETKGEVFILFVADFFLKRYISSNQNEPINFLLSKMQEEISLERIGTKPLNALSLYIIQKITKKNDNLHSIRCEHNVIEFIIHRLSMMDMVDEEIDEESLHLAKKAKEQLLKDCISPPSIQELAHLCATNESKLKKVFKRVYNSTIYGYIQKLRLQKADYLLKDKLLTIGEVAKEVGYKHQGHFSKLFFETYGVYPKELLKK